MRASASADEVERALDDVLSQIDPVTLAADVGSPIDAARMSFLLDSVTVDSDRTFFDTVCAFQAHLLRHLGEIPPETKSEALADDVYEQIQKAFAREGGIEGAISEAKSAVRGGMRRVLDAMTDHLKRERMAMRVNRILKESLEDVDWEGRLAFAKAFLKRMEPHLPEDLREEKAEQCAHHYEELARTYVRSMEGVRELLRRL
jgi:hypothetical protein